MNYINIDDKNKIVTEIAKSWELSSHSIDERVMEDIFSAIEEAYTTGCLHGGLDKDIFQDALNFYSK